MDKTKFFRCPHCGSLAMIKKGIQSGHQRYYCKDYCSYFTHRRPDVSVQNRFVWFRQWVEQGHKIESISKRSGYSERTLKSYFHAYLSDHQTWHIRPSEKVNLMIDGMYFSNKVCLVLYQDNNIKTRQLDRLTGNEWVDEIVYDLNSLISLGIRIGSVTCDTGSKHHKSVRKCTPKAIIQRCTARVQREIQLWLTKRPKRGAGRELRAIVGKLNSITDREYLNQKTIPDDAPPQAWFTHKMCKNYSFISAEHCPIFSTISTILTFLNRPTRSNLFSDT